jgi:hypothetical protein
MLPAAGGVHDSKLNELIFYERLGAKNQEKSRKESFTSVAGNSIRVFPHRRP